MSQVSWPGKNYVDERDKEVSEQPWVQAKEQMSTWNVGEAVYEAWTIESLSHAF